MNIMRSLNNNAGNPDFIALHIRIRIIEGTSHSLPLIPYLPYFHVDYTFDK